MMCVHGRNSTDRAGDVLRDGFGVFGVFVLRAFDSVRRGMGRRNFRLGVPSCVKVRLKYAAVACSEDAFAKVVLMRREKSFR